MKIMVAEHLLCWLVLNLLLLCCSSSSPDRPILRTQSGNLILEGANGKDISLKSRGSGCVTVNGVDISRSFALIESVKPQLETLNVSSVGFLLRNLSRVVHDVSSESRLAENLESFANRLTSSETTITNLQNSQNTHHNLLDSLRSNVSRIFTQIITPEYRSQIQNITRWLRENQNRGDGSSTGPSNTQVRSILRRMSVLENQVGDFSQIEDRVLSLEIIAGNGTGGSSAVNARVSRDIRRLKRSVNNVKRRLRIVQRSISNDNCDSNPCHNGGTCIDTATSAGFFCLCPSGFEGATCNQDVNECVEFIGTDIGCQNGATCVNTVGSYTCTCLPGWYGVHCTQRTDSCATSSGTELCGHGVCIPTPKDGHSYYCLCDQGWKKAPGSPACVQDVNECMESKPACSHDPPVQCINNYGSFTCGQCPPGYEGNGFACRDIDECAFNNGGCSLNPRVECINSRPGRRCGPCPPGYSGDGTSCQSVSPCQMNPCHHLASCHDNPMMSSTYFTCTCPYGYSGNGMGPGGCVPISQGGGGSGGGYGGNPCSSNPCAHGLCQPYMGHFTCVCNPGYTGQTCALPVDACASSPCLNGGTCSSFGTSVTCRCPSTHTGDRCQTLNRVCGGYLSGQGGIVNFPGENQMTYQHNISCAWVIHVNHTQVITVNFTSFHLEESTPSCVYDWLQIHDGPGSSAHLIGRFCGRDTPGTNGTLTSTHNSLYLWFRSDHSLARTGFSFLWNATQPSCGGDIRGLQHGAINSPGYPGMYPILRDCYWTIRVDPGKRIQFAFATLQIETHSNCSYDYLAIYDGLTEEGTPLAKYCSTQTPPPLVTSGSEATLHFHSDESLRDTGFHITFMSTPGIHGCGGTLTADAAEFSTPTIDNQYHHNLQCEWLIRVPPGEKIELNFTQFRLEGSRRCYWDFVEVRDGGSGESPLIGRFCGTELPDPIRSTTNRLFIRFLSDYSIAYEGFTARYRVDCGGEYTAESGVIKSPYHPNNYPHNRVCIYTIRLPPGKAIVVNFTSFNLEDSFGECYFDYVEIRDGLSGSSPLMGKYCGPSHRVPDLITSSMNGLYLKFKTDGSVSNRGFSASYSTIDTRCGGIHHELTGTISSPSSPDQYPSNSDCTWVINVPGGYVIQLTWHTFALEDHFSCNYDYVEVFDNSTIPGTGGQIGSRYCGSTVPPIMTSLENIMTIHFHSDHSLTHDGFSASYHALHTDRVCGGNYHSTYGRLQSPNFPNGYPHDRTCIWTITVPRNHQIKLNFTDFDVEGEEPNCPFDSLEIRNGKLETSPLLQKVCGRNRTVASVFSHHHQLYLKFKTDSSVSGRGFQIFWEEKATGCGGTMTSPTGEITSPGYPQASFRLSTCIWTIRVNKGSKIMFTFFDLDFQQRGSGCYRNYVEVRNGPSLNSPLVGRYCNNEGLVSINSTSNELKIKFRGGWVASGRGFRARYHSVCNTVLEGPFGIIESPNFPNPYPHAHNCTWTIKAPLGNAINISFSHFQVEGRASEVSSNCEYDFVEVRVGHQQPVSSDRRLVGHYCGSTIPDPIHSGTGKDLMDIQFKTDGSVAMNGFRLEWIISGCGGILKDQYGSFQSPNFPNAYPPNTVCEWHIVAHAGLRLRITIQEFDIESSFSNSRCIFDSLKVYGGQDRTSPVLLTLCHHEQSSKTVTTQGTNALVVLISDGSVRGRGFRATYQMIQGGCGGDFSATKGEIHSPNYPENYDNHADCIWHLRSNQNHVVELEFKDFDIEPHLNCSYDYLAVYDGPDTDSPVISHHCGPTLPSPAVIKSTGPHMVLRLKADPSMTGRGFKAEYREACGATLDVSPLVTSNAITSPKFPGLVTPQTTCTWHLKAQEGSKVELRFTHMNLVGMETMRRTNETCPYDYVQVLDGEDTDATEIGRFCGTRLPRQLFSSSQYMTVNLRTVMPQGTGFRALYSSVDTACGGVLTSQSGEFGTPNYPDSYPANYECIWRISVGQGNRVQINFETFDLEESEGCNLDYVEIHEGGPEGELLMHSCGTSIPSSFTATGTLWIKFKSDGEGTAGGFLANFVLLTSNVLTSESGVIESPLYPHLFTLRGEYSWSLMVPQGRYISFQIMDISIELNPVEDVCYSSLVIHDGHSASARVLQTLCGHEPPSTPIITYENVAFIRFVSNYRHEGSYFKLRYETLFARPQSNAVIVSPTGPDPNCSYVVTINSTYSFQSKNYPENYENNMNCQWILQTEKHSRIFIRFTFELEESYSCLYDKIEIYDGIDGRQEWNKTGTLCRRNQRTRQFYSSGSVMKIVFKTDSSVTKKGFVAYLSKVCGGILTEAEGAISTPNYPSDYPGFSFCQWKIKARVGRTIQISFTSFRIANMSATCIDDFLLIYNGPSRSSPFLGRGRFCGISPSLQIPETSSNNALLYFQSDFLNSDKGFHLTYSEVSGGCGGNHQLTMDVPTITIESPNYPHPAHPHTECIWIVTGEYGKTLVIDFQDTFDITTNNYGGACVDAFVEVRDGGTQLSESLGRFCGNQIPNTVTGFSGMLYIRYYTNAATVHSGFRAKIETGKCGGTYYLAGGYLPSPNYPDPYGNNLNCTWHVVGPFGHYLMFEFTEMNIYNPSVNCTSNAGRLTIIDTVLNGSATFCGSELPPMISTGASNATITFTNFQEGGLINRFRLLISASREACGGTFSGTGGVIQSPGYPHGHTHAWMCQYKLQGPPGSKITLTFEDLDLPVSQYGYCHATIRVHNGIDDHSPMMTLPFCGNDASRAFNSSMNSMNVVFYAYRPSSARGFKARWSSQYEQECGGAITGTRGSVASPGFEAGGYDHGMYCVWTITNPSPSTSSIDVTIRHLHLEEGCYDYILLEGLDPSGMPVYTKRMCHGEETLHYNGPYPAVRISFISDYSINGTGFNISYDLRRCGGYHLGPQTPFKSPGYVNGSYPPNSVCNWVFDYPEGSQVEVEFLDFRLENSLNHDYVKLYNGPDPSSPLLGHYTGTTSPGVVGPTMSNKAFVNFKSDGSTSARGFSAVARAHTRGCGGVFHNSGNISSPGFDSGTDYGSNVECIWEIRSEPGYQVEARFVDSFDLETSEDCRNDYVKMSVPDADTSWNELGRWCGKQMPPPMASNSSAVQVMLRSNGAIEGKGFKISFMGKCGGTHQAEEGIIFSPNFPDTYPDRISCQYGILASSESYVVLNFSDFSVESSRDGCSYDSLVIQQKVGLRLVTRQTLCGVELPEPIVLKGPVFLNFTTDYNTPTNNNGFRIKYNIKACGGVVSEPGVVSLPTHPGNYMRLMNCVWNVTAPEGKIVYIKFQVLHLEEHSHCRYDHVSVFEVKSGEEDRLVAKLCGDHTDSLPVVATSTRRARIEFRSDYSVSRPGFVAAIDFSEKCGSVVNVTNALSTETVRSPDFNNDGQYDPSSKCQWVIQGNPDMIVFFNFTRLAIEGPTQNDTLPCPYDSIQLFDGPSTYSPSLGEFCGTSLPSQAIFASSDVMLAVFHSDSANQSAGFSAVVGNSPRLCGSPSLVVSSTQEPFQSPNYPSNYPARIRCRWIFTAPEDSRIRFHIDEFNIEQSRKCTKDKFFIGEMPEEDSETLVIDSGTRRDFSGYRMMVRGHPVYFTYGSDLDHTYCGEVHPQFLESSTNRVQVQFFSDDDVTASGFRLHYVLATCNTTYHADAGEIYASHSNGGNCYGTVSTSPGKFVTLHVLQSYFATRLGGSLKVYDGDSSASPVLRDLGGWRGRRNPIYSSGNSLHIVGLNFPPRSYYRLLYSTSEFRNGCGGKFFGMRNIVASPNYPGVAPTNVTCIYTVAVPFNYHAALRFGLMFDVGGGGGCNSTYLEIYDVLPSNEARLFTTYCEGDNPAVHLSPTNRLVLRYVTGTETVTGVGWRASVIAANPHSDSFFDELDDSSLSTTASP